MFGAVARLELETLEGFQGCFFFFLLNCPPQCCCLSNSEQNFLMTFRSSIRTVLLPAGG